MNKHIRNVALAGLISITLPLSVQADIINFDFTGRLIVAGPDGSILFNNELPYTPIAASLSYDTVAGIGSSSLSITMNDFFMNAPATFHDISMTHNAGTNTITGQVLVDWNVTSDMPLHVEWDATGLLNAIDLGLQAGDKLSGTNLFRDFNNDGIWDASEWIADINSATPYSDSLQFSAATQQGPAPLAATSGSMGFDETTPFQGIRGYFDIGSGNSMYVTSVSAVPIPTAVWFLDQACLA